MPNLRTLQYSENDVINLFAYTGNGAFIPVNKGTFVTISGSGFVNDQTDTLFRGGAGATYAGTLSQRYGPQAQVSVATTGDVAVGCLLYDVREVDENGEKLIYNPRKAIENNWVISGQTVPILTRGLVLYSGVNETVTAGQVAWVSGGQLTNTGPASVAGTAGMYLGSRAGQFLGTKDDQGWVLVKLNCGV